MNERLEELVALLADESAELSAFGRLLDDERQALLRAEAGVVGELALRKDEVLGRLGALERRRRALLESLARSLGVPADTLTTSALLRSVPDAPPALAKRRDEMRTVLTALLERNRTNGLMIGETLRVLEGLVKSLVNAMTPAPTYAGRGGPAAALPLQLLDRRA